MLSGVFIYLAAAKPRDKLSAKGVRFLLSNAAVPRILELYKEYEIEQIDATRAINSVVNKRGVVAEVLVRNYRD